MDKRFLLYDGEKAVSLTGEEGWTTLSNYPRSTQDEQYAKVAAAYRAYNIKANTVGNMPFVLYKGEEEFDASATWENKVGFLPNPSELFRLVELSLIATNTAYNLRTKDILGLNTKGLYHAVAYSFQPYTKPSTGELDYIQRSVGAQIERYAPDDKRLVRLWRLDHTTEVLPSQNTEALAIMSAAGSVYYADLWIQHFYRRGGIPPTLIAMKGLIMKGKGEDEEKSWTDWLKGLGRWTQRIARIFNAEAMDIKQMGSSVADLKNNEVYRQALENIAMGTGIPLSLLLANSANRATAENEKATWYENDIIPLVMWIAYEYNRQVFEPLGLRLEFKPETLDPNQEDETERAEAMDRFIDFLVKCPSADVALETCATFGYELTDGLIAAINKHFSDKEKKEKELQKQQMAVSNQPTAQPVQKPIPSANGNGAKQPAKWSPSLDELNELKVWREVALRKLKKSESLDFIYQPHHGGLPANVQNKIVDGLPNCKSVQEIKDIFDMSKFVETITPAPVYAVDDIKMLADALNRLASVNVTPVEVKEVSQPVINIHTPPISLTTQMPAMGEPSITFAPVIQPSEVSVQVTNEVQPAPVEVTAENNITVQPADVKVIPEKQKEVTIKVERDRDGKIKGAQGKIE